MFKTKGFGFALTCAAMSSWNKYFWVNEVYAAVCKIKSLAQGDAQSHAEVRQRLGGTVSPTESLNAAGA